MIVLELEKYLNHNFEPLQFGGDTRTYISVRTPDVLGYIVTNLHGIYDSKFENCFDGSRGWFHLNLDSPDGLEKLYVWLETLKHECD